MFRQLFNFQRKLFLVGAVWFVSGFSSEAAIRIQDELQSSRDRQQVKPTNLESHDDDLPWREVTSASSNLSPLHNVNGAPQVARPIPAGPIPARLASQGGSNTMLHGQPIPSHLIPTTPAQPPAQLIPNAVPPVPVYPAGYQGEPQLFHPSVNQENMMIPATTDHNRLTLEGGSNLSQGSGFDVTNPIQLVSGMESTTTQTPTQDGVSAITRVTKGVDSLPNSAGQVWREYDISPYTYSITNSTRPQQALIDWILLETGQELWFNEPLGILSASKEKLRVYHTPQVQLQVQNIVDRFVYGRGRNEVIGMKLVTINNPTWRTIAYNRMQPIAVKAAGVEGWLISKENAAILINELSRRNDFQLHNGGDVIVHDGQKYNLASRRPIQFFQSLKWVNAGNVVYAEPVTTQFNEGYSIEFSSLSSIDGRSCEAVIQCEIDQIEKLQKVNVNVPTSTGQMQSVDLQIPQMVSWNVHERFRWPSDQVLLLSCGVVATPGPKTNNLLDINGLLNGSRRRADALLFIEYKGPVQSGNPNGFSPTANIPVNSRR